MRTAVALGLWGLALCWHAGVSAQPQIQLQMSADRTQISADERVTVQIQVQAEGTDSPDVELPPFEGFQVVSRQVQRPMQFSFNFGQRAVVRSSVNYVFGLAPLKLGKITIPPVQVRAGGKLYRSQPLTIEVTGSAPPPGQAPPGDAPATQDPGAQGMADAAQVDDVAFLRTVVDKPTPFEREQVTVTIYLYLRERLQNTPNIEQEASTDGFWVHDLLPANYQLRGRRQSVNGQLYNVYVLRRFAAFPLKPGELTIGAMSVKIDRSSVFDLFGGRRGTPVVSRSSVPVTLAVQPLPERADSTEPAYVGRFELSTKLDRAQAVTGDAVTLTATIKGQGDIRTVKLATPTVPGLRILDPQVKDLVEAPNDLVGGERVYTWLIVPEQPGEHTIPPLGFDAFDPVAKRYTRVEAAALTLTAAGAALATDTNPDAAPTESDEAPTPTAEGAERFPPIRVESALSRGDSRLLGEAWYPWTLPLPPLVWLSVLLVSAVRRRVAARASTAAERASRLSRERAREASAAAERGDSAAFHAAAAAALSAMLEARTGQPVGGYTHAELSSHLTARGMEPELATATVEQLEQADYARFSPGDSSDEALRSARDRLQKTLERLGRFEPTPEGPA